MLIPAALVLPCAGCLTITSSSVQRIPVTTEPPGALARSGEAACRTPCQLEVPRAEPEPVELTLDGYEPAHVPLQRELRAAWLWNLAPPLSLALILAPPLWAADFLSGTAYRVEPEQLTLSLQPLAAGPAAEASEPIAPPSRPALPPRQPELWSHGKATVVWSAYDLRGVGLGVQVSLPPWEFGAGSGWHRAAPLDAWHAAIDAGAGVDLSKELRATLLAEGGVMGYAVSSPADTSWLGETRHRVLQGGSASYPFVGTRASLTVRLGRRGWLMLGLTGFARRTSGSREIPYAIETCRSDWLWGGVSCSTETGSARAGGAIYGVGLLVGSRFDWKESAAAPPDAGGASRASAPE